MIELEIEAWHLAGAHGRYRVRWRSHGDMPWRTFVLVGDERQTLLDLVDAALTAASSYLRAAA